MSKKFKQRMFVFGFEIQTIKSKLHPSLAPWVYVKWTRFWDTVEKIKALVNCDYRKTNIDTNSYNFDKTRDVKKFLLKMDNKDIEVNIMYCSIENKFCYKK